MCAKDAKSSANEAEGLGRDESFGARDVFFHLGRVNSKLRVHGGVEFF